MRHSYPTPARCVSAPLGYVTVPSGDENKKEREMSEKKTTFAEEVGCAKAIWNLFHVFVLTAMNGGLWYMLLVHIDAPPRMWVLFCAWIPSHLCISAISCFFDWFHKMAQAKERA